MEPKHGDAIMMLEPKTYTSVSRNVLTAYIMMKVSTTTFTLPIHYFYRIDGDKATLSSVLTLVEV